MIVLLPLLLAELVAVAWTTRLAAADDPVAAGTWAALLAGPPADLLLVLARLLACAASWWVLVGTVHDVVVATRAAVNGTRSRRVAPTWVRRAVDRAIGTAIAIAVLAGPAHAATGDDGPAVLVVVDPPAPPLDLLAPPPAAVPATPVPAPDGPPGPIASPAPAPAPAPVPSPAAAGTHVVAVGENLWTIARGLLVAGGAEAPDDRAVHGAWIALIRANDVPSGDPDLIHPGLVLQVPADLGAGT